MRRKIISEKPIKNFPDYFVTDTGQVISRKRKNKEIVLCPTTTNDGHLVVNLYKDGKSHPRLVHQLVIKAFKGPPPTKKHQTRHRDDNPTNNNIANLEWGTSKQNHADRKRQAKSRVAELTDEEVRQIRELGRSDGGRTKWFDFKTIGRMYGISARYVANIVKRRIRADVPDYEVPHYKDGVLVVMLPTWQRKRY